MQEKKHQRKKALVTGLAVACTVFCIQLFRIQVLDEKYKISAINNAIRTITQYPARGLILDRNGNILVGNKVTYDISLTPATQTEFDTLALCSIFGTDTSSIKERFREFRRNRRRIGYQSIILFKQVSAETYSHFAEQAYKFPGFSAIPRSTRNYTYDACGNLLGYVSEVDSAFIRKNPEYSVGDMAGKTGLEYICEKELRGEKGKRYYLRNVHNLTLSRYENGEYDVSAIPGNNVTTTIDAELQHYTEMLMKNKIGSVVAIEPHTGEILALVSSPGIETAKLGEINRYYNEIASDPLKPMFNRAIMSSYPPGSVFKILNALIALQYGTAGTETRFECHDGYSTGNFRLKCHHHRSPVDMNESIMMSCNAYYCCLFRDYLDNGRWNSISESMDRWAETVRSFGFGSPSGSEFPSELGGNVPDASTYDRIYGKNRWRSLSVVSLSIGQGELGVTPLQMANYAAILANRGYYRKPHILRDNSGTETYSRKNYTLIDTALFERIIPGMYNAVNRSAEDGATGWRAKVPGLDICGKTGTAQNPHGEDHAVFIGFAPKDNPRIAVAVYIENAGFGGTWAAPLGSLVIEKYLNDSIARTDTEKFITSADFLKRQRP